jgi:hypothetical protein
MAIFNGAKGGRETYTDALVTTVSAAETLVPHPRCKAIMLSGSSSSLIAWYLDDTNFVAINYNRGPEMFVDVPKKITVVTNSVIVNQLF